MARLDATIHYRFGELNEGATATAAAACGTGVTVVADDDLPSGDIFQGETPDGQSLTRASQERQLQHLVEIAVIH